MNSSITSLSPTPRNGKHGWYDQFRKHNLLLKKSKAKLLIIGDSLVSNLSRYPEIWRKYFSNHGALNFGIAGDKAQNVLWRVNNLHFSSDLHLKYIFILCGTNNIDHNSPQSIASTIISTGLEFQKSLKFQVIALTLLPNDHKHSKRREIINTVNKLLKCQCLDNGFQFLEFKSNWLNNVTLLTWNSFTMITFNSYGKTMNYWQKKLWTLLSFEIHGDLYKTFMKGHYFFFI